MTEIGWATLGVIPSFNGFARDLDRGTSKAMLTAGTSGGTVFGNAAGRSAGARFGSVFKTAAKAGLIGLAGIGAGAFKLGGDAIEQASTLNESLNAVTVTYGKQAKAVKKLGGEAADALGLSNTEFNSLAVRYSAFAKTIGGNKNTVRILDDLTTRAADFASVMNLEVNEAAELFQSGLAGETEPLRKYGLDLSAAAVQAHALAVGIADSKGELTESEKVQARYSLLMKDTAKVQGDFANTSDSLANRQRILNARWDDAQAKLGTALLPIMEDLVGVIIDKGLPAFEKFSDWFVEDGIPAFKQAAEFGGDVADVVGDIVGWMNKLPSEAKLAALGAIFAGGTALKLRGGGGGLLGTAGSAIGLAKPVPVFVTNPGFGVGGVGGDVGGAAGKGGKLSGALKGVAKYAVPVAALAASLKTVDTLLDDAASRRDPGTKNFDFGKLGYSNDIFIDMSAPATAAGKDAGGAAGAAFSAAFIAQTAAAADEAKLHKLLPKTIQTRFDLLGVPESERELRHILQVYDLTPKQKTTTLELLGYEPMLDRIRRVNASLDWAARPREARISVTKVYSAAGYETQGGIPEGMSNDSRSRRRGGGGV